MQTYDIGDVAVLKGAWKDETGVYADPTYVTFSANFPDGSTVAYVYGTDLEVVKDDMGQYHVNLPVLIPGFYQYHFSSQNPDGTVDESLLQAAADEWLYGIDKSIELSTLSHVKDFSETKGTTDDQVIQLCLVALSRYIYNRVGRTTLGTIVTVSQIYNGSGSNVLFLRDWPVKTLTSVFINGISMPLSTGYGVGGVAVDGTRQDRLVIASPMSGSMIPYLSTSPGRFVHGIRNVQVNMIVGYGCVPEDLEQAVCEGVSLNYKRKQWQDMKSQSTSTAGSTGTTTFRDWHLTPGIERVIQDYSRKTY